MRLAARQSLRFMAALALMAGIARTASGEGNSIFDDMSLAPSTRPAVVEPAPAKTPTPPVTTPSTPKTDPQVAPVRPPPGDVVVPPPMSSGPVTSPLASKMAIPDAAATARVMKLVKQVFEKEYADKSPAAKGKLAGELITEAEKIRSNFDARYVLLAEALSGGLAAGEVDPCKRAIADMEESFKVDAVSMEIETAGKLAAHSPADAALVGWILQLADRHIQDEQYVAARKLLHLISSSARTKDPAESMKLKSLEQILVEHDKVQLAVEKLKHDPADPTANLTAGKFYCFVKRDWPRGLPLLARCSDQKLKDVAQKDLASPSSTSQKYELAGQWWDAARDRAHSNLVAQLHERAAYWYGQALPELSGLEKTMAEKRMADVPAESQVVPVQLAGIDVGHPDTPGSFKYDVSAQGLVVNGAGRAVWATVDELYFLGQRSAKHDGSIIAQVKSQADTHRWARAGVMFRSDKEVNAYYAAVFVTPSEGVVFQWRGGPTFSKKTETPPAVKAPCWIKLTRAGSRFTGYYSKDGVAWTELGNAECPNISAAPLVGFAVCAGMPGKVGSATFSNITLP